jgi:hypothetical protein
MSLRRDLSGFHGLHDTRTTPKPRSDEPRPHPAGDKDLRRRVDYFGHTPLLPVMLANFFIVTRAACQFFRFKGRASPFGTGLYGVRLRCASARRHGAVPSPALGIRLRPCGLRSLTRPPAQSTYAKASVDKRLRRTRAADSDSAGSPDEVGQ